MSPKIIPCITDCGTDPRSERVSISFHRSVSPGQKPIIMLFVSDFAQHFLALKKRKFSSELINSMVDIVDQIAQKEKNKLSR